MDAFKDHGEKNFLNIVKQTSSFNREMRILTTKYILKIEDSMKKIVFLWKNYRIYYLW